MKWQPEIWLEYIIPVAIYYWKENVCNERKSKSTYTNPNFHKILLNYRRNRNIKLLQRHCVKENMSTTVLLNHPLPSTFMWKRRMPGRQHNDGKWRAWCQGKERDWPGVRRSMSCCRPRTPALSGRQDEQRTKQATMAAPDEDIGSGRSRPDVAHWFVDYRHKASSPTIFFPVTNVKRSPTSECGGVM